MKTWWVGLSTSLAIFLSSCGSGGGSAAVEEALPAFVAGVDHAFLPLVPGRTWLYEGMDEGEERQDSVESLGGDRKIMGVLCTALYQEVTIGGEPFERTWEWYAQDERGNVWKFGEESLELEDETWTRTPDSWVAGEGGARPWIALSAAPRVGDEFVGGPPGHLDRFVVTSVSETVRVPAGEFAGCLRVVENPDDPEDSDIILYAPGVGRISEIASDAETHLIGVFGG